MGFLSKIFAKKESQNNLEKNNKYSAVYWNDNINIPNEIVDLMWFYDGPRKNLSSNEEVYKNENISLIFSIHEPSAISITLPIGNKIKASKLGYFPSYEKLNPDERYTYLKWLEDISQPIDIGYVFIFYYGLERNILNNRNVKESEDMIIKLRKYHNNSSFQFYSNDALILSSVIRKDFDLLNFTINQNSDFATKLSFKAFKNKFLSAYDIYDIGKSSTKYVNRRYINSNPNEFILVIKNVLIKLFNEDIYDISHINVNDVPLDIDIVIANYSIESELRSIKMPNILGNTIIDGTIKQILENSNEIVKILLKESKKISNNEDVFNDNHIRSIIDLQNIQLKQIEYKISNIYVGSKSKENPKFSRTEKEDKLSHEFSLKYSSQISNQEDKIYKASWKVADLDTRDKKINQYKKCLDLYENFKDFCYSKGDGGKIYFDDMWEHCHNSSDPCFSFGDRERDRMNELIKERDIYLPGILDTINKNDGVIQKDIYTLLPDIPKSTIQKLIRELESEDKIIRIKKSGSYELRVNK
ncbi:TerB N-terminal domain-containing protein [Peptostreptococcus equinus]|uniref:TerB N-terminal domain-containing protein n=1 Tax=Peptostreptococcus equinus TaxID=3003601 RepID=A0ABY7JTE0_9FIRM|nr:TerB N-terminal domain-containing protein [Peptostreptococcus sp. CBA3647]WAW15749.1 TerB N-terminal domain-containing protein [Peptostreptococcus sp. CBA3647]